MDYNSKGGDIMKFPETANRIRQILDLRGMTAQQLAERSGVGKSSISHYVNGSNEPHNQNAGKMAAVLHCDPQWLMGFDVDKANDETPVFIPNTENWSKAIRYMDPDDYKTVLEIFKKAFDKMKEKGVEP
jgi:transcriptional regulator with XRE-family HTH domain